MANPDHFAALATQHTRAALRVAAALGRRWRIEWSSAWPNVRILRIFRIFRILRHALSPQFGAGMSHIASLVR
jgi:hypothetical protein